MFFNNCFVSTVIDTAIHFSGATCLEEGGNIYAQIDIDIWDFSASCPYVM